MDKLKSVSFEERLRQREHYIKNVPVSIRTNISKVLRCAIMIANEHKGPATDIEISSFKYFDGCVKEGSLGGMKITINELLESLVIIRRMEDNKIILQRELYLERCIS